NFTTTGIFNAATGTSALASNTTGTANTATGENALASNTTGRRNTAMGEEALFNNTTGNDNTAIGTSAGLNLTGSNNIDMAAGVSGEAGEFDTIRIGNADNRATFIAGISRANVGTGGAAVLVNSDGMLGTIASSRRFKDDIQDMGEASSDLMKLRPVT